MPYLLFAHPQQNKLNILIKLILSFSRIDGKVKHCKQSNNLNAFDVDIHVATLIIINDNYKIGKIK